MTEHEEIWRRIEQKIDEVAKMLKAAPTPTKDIGHKVCTDAELDDKYGNPEVKISPSRWTGRDYTGWKYGDCPSEFLTEMAGMLDAISRKQSQDPTKAKFADWSAKDAARARGWAARNKDKPTTEQSTAVKPAYVDPMDWGNDDELPF